MNMWFIAGAGAPKEEVEAVFQSIAKLAKGLQLVYLDDIAFIVDTGLPPKVFIKGEPVSSPDIYFMAGNYDSTMKIVGDQLDLLGCFAYNSMTAKSIAMSKITTNQVFAKAGVPIIKSIPIFKSVTKDFLLKQLGLPMVVKPDNGFGGSGVTLIKTESELESAIEKAHNSQCIFIAQEYIKISKGFDFRVGTVNNTAIYAVKRQTNNPDEFRSNVSLGASIVKAELTQEMIELSEKAAKASGLDFAGLDLLVGKDGYIIGEVNSTPGAVDETYTKEFYMLVMKDIEEKYLAFKKK